MTPIEGRARKFGDAINTDYIITSRRKRENLDPQYLRHYLFEEIAADFAASIREGDLIVAGSNFGCGSAMEVAVTAVVGAGIRAVLAKSFSRTYYRNSVNNGLLPVICDTARISEGDRLRVVSGSVENLSTGETLPWPELPPVMQRIIAAGGLVGYMRDHGGF